MDNLWDRTLLRIKEQVNLHVYETWFEPTNFQSFQDKTLTITVPNPFFREWLEENYSSRLTKILTHLTSDDITLEIQIREGSNGNSGSGQVTPETPEVNGEGFAGGYPAILNQKYTFSSFVVGNSNQFAHAAARAVAEAPSVAYNPLFLYGGVGLGKTHLMHSIGHAILNNYPEKRLLYLPAEQFMNEMINAFRFSRVVEIREKYRNMDVLMIDDIQYIAGRERTQMEFFHTFNTLYESQKQIIISSDLFPKEIPTLEERLRSRFEWGLIADIQPPDLETKVAILYKKAELNGISLPNDVVMFIADNIKSNIRELEGCLIRLNAVASLMKKKIDLPFTEKVLKDMVENDEKLVTVDIIQKVVAKHFAIKVQMMRSKTRTKDIAFPRQIAMYLCRDLTSESLPAIGKQFGGKDHTTILYGCDKIKKLMKTDINLRKNLDLLVEKITGR